MVKRLREMSKVGDSGSFIRRIAMSDESDPTCRIDDDLIENIKRQFGFHGVNTSSDICGIAQKPITRGACTRGRTLAIFVRFGGSATFSHWRANRTLDLRNPFLTPASPTRAFDLRLHVGFELEKKICDLLGR